MLQSRTFAGSTSRRHRFAWYARRLRAMKPTEISERGRRTVVHRTDAALYAFAPAAWNRRWMPEARSIIVSELSGTTHGPLVPERAVAIRHRFPQECADLLE